MTQKKRTCLACGRPLTGRQQKWCGHPDCGGWEAVHPLIMIECELCGETFQYRKGYERTKCYSCERIGYPRSDHRSMEICIECGGSFDTWNKGFGDAGVLWCSKKCERKYFQRNPPPDYFAEDRLRARKNLCFYCGEFLFSEKVPTWGHKIGFCSVECDAAYNARERFRRRIDEQRLLQKEGSEKAGAFSIARSYQWRALHVDRRLYIDTPEYQEEYNSIYDLEARKLSIRMKLGLPENAPLPEKIIPLTTEIPIKLWFEENSIEFETQKYIEFSDTFTLVDFFIPLPSYETGVCLYCDGDYWHGPEFPEIQEKDEMQVRELEKLGYIVIRLSETDIEHGIRPLEILKYVEQ
jgi:hypothetical protein